MAKNISIIIIAAGKGTRMKSKTTKTLHKIGNLEMMNHVIKTAEELEADEIVLVSSKENNAQLKEKVISPRVQITIQEELTGTATAVKSGLQCLKHTDNDVLVMYGDGALIKTDTYLQMLEKIKNTDASIIVLGFHTANIQNKYGRLIVNSDDELDRIVEYKDATDKQRAITLCNSGVLVVRGGLLESLLSRVNNNNANNEYYLTDIVEIAKSENKKCKFIIAQEEEVLGVNSRAELAIAEEIFQNNKRQEMMLKGVTLRDPKTVYFSYDTEIAEDVVIEQNVVFMTGVKVESGATIRAFSYLEDSHIKSGAAVGPFARLRGGNSIGEDTKIGNFVEIKKSNIGEGTKIQHLTYIGDSDVGEHTNIGAGTITSNYDGYSKFKTKIGKNSFIGTNTIMVAPVELGENSMTGAGSIITKNVEDNALAIARAEQINKQDGATRYRKKREK